MSKKCKRAIYIYVRVQYTYHCHQHTHDDSLRPTTTTNDDDVTSASGEMVLTNSSSHANIIATTVKEFRSSEANLFGKNNNDNSFNVGCLVFSKLKQDLIW